MAEQAQSRVQNAIKVPITLFFFYCAAVNVCSPDSLNFESDSQGVKWGNLLANHRLISFTQS